MTVVGEGNKERGTSSRDLIDLVQLVFFAEHLACPLQGQRCFVCPTNSSRITLDCRGRRTGAQAAAPGTQHGHTHARAHTHTHTHTLPPHRLCEIRIQKLSRELGGLKELALERRARRAHLQDKHVPLCHRLHHSLAEFVLIRVQR